MLKINSLCGKISSLIPNKNSYLITLPSSLSKPKGSVLYIFLYSNTAPRSAEETSLA